MLTQKQKVILTIVIVATLIVGAGITFGVMKWKMDTMQSTYERQVDTLKNTIKSIGPIESCYTVLKQTSAGGRILQSDLVPVNIPQSCVGESYILDPASIVGKYYKVAINTGTPITSDMIMEDKITDDLREVDITSDTWPIGLKEGDFIDYRLVFPQGEDFIVLSHLRVMQINDKTLKVYVTERELMFYGSALIEKFLYSQNGATTYMTKYLEPGVQKAAKISYCVPDNIKAMIVTDPNILDKAIAGALTREIIERSISDILSINNGQGGQTIGAGRTDYLAKLEEARKKNEQQAAVDGTTDGSYEAVTPSATTPATTTTSSSLDATTPTAGGSTQGVVDKPVTTTSGN